MQTCLVCPGDISWASSCASSCALGPTQGSRWDLTLVGTQGRGSRVDRLLRRLLAGSGLGAQRPQVSGGLWDLLRVPRGGEQRRQQWQRCQGWRLSQHHRGRTRGSWAGSSAGMQGCGEQDKPKKFLGAAGLMGSTPPEGKAAQVWRCSMGHVRAGGRGLPWPWAPKLPGGSDERCRTLEMGTRVGLSTQEDTELGVWGLGSGR